MSEENTGINEIKTPVSDLKIGMFVSRLDKDWSESSFLLQGILIETEDDIKQFAQECSYVYVEGTAQEPPPAAKETTVQETAEPAKKSTFSFAKKEAEPILTPHEMDREQAHRLSDIMELKIAPEMIKPPKKVTSFANEMGIAKLTLNKIGSLLKQVMIDIKAGKPVIDSSAAEQVIHDCITSVLRSPDAMLLAMNQKGKHYTVWEHGMNVAILAINLGRHLNLADQELLTLGLAGMFHDVGNLLLSKDGLEKAIDKREFVRSHTTLGKDLLSKSPGQLGSVVAEVAYSHHENLDGSGFPRALKDTEITAYTRIISIVSLYNILTTDTGSRKALSHYDAMAELLQEAEKNHLDKNLVNSFNQFIGAYPVGSYVEMNSGEIGLVVEALPEQRLKPIVMIFTTADKKECPRQLVNLAKANAYTIKGIIRSEQYVLEL